MNEQLVAAAYRALLGREPENEQVVADIARGTRGDAEAILRAFVNSNEYKTRFSSFLDIIAYGYALPRLPIDTDVSDELLARFFARIKEQWTKLGTSEPFYSVLTHEQYKQSNFSQNSETFYKSGESTCAMVDYFAERNGVILNRGCCVELGCGVGRVTRHLATRFAQVFAVDISEGNLAHCRAHMEREGINNVAYCLLSSPIDIKNVPTADFFYSIITLQHNPPPIQRYLLDEILRKLNSAGCCLFQTPTNGMNYSFKADLYLNSPPQEMEVHCLPMHVVLRLLQDRGFELKEVAMDALTGSYGSHTFFAQKR